MSRSAGALMRRFRCEHCGHEVSFETSTCPVCRSSLGYVPDQLTIRQLHGPRDGASWRVAGAPGEVWRCLNAAWDCNWTLPAGSGATWCRSCALTRGRPDDGRADAIDAWAVVEAAKRRLVHQLDVLGLPVEARAPSVPNGLVFDLVYVPGEVGITGHLDGVVTIDLAEADSVHRDALRRRLGEPSRTLIGNLRHEIAHHFWPRLVGQGDSLGRFRALFGDERADYASALDQYYGTTSTTWDASRTITRYAQAHPHEDWAETFAHYLHLIDLVDTASAYELTTSAGPAHGRGAATFRRVVDTWQLLARAHDGVADAVDADHLYPFELRGLVLDKLEFVHERVIASAADSEFCDETAVS